MLSLLEKKAYRATMALYEKKPGNFRAAVDNPEPVELGNRAVLFPVYHCSQQVINTGTRGEEEQNKDWRRIRKYL